MEEKLLHQLWKYRLFDVQDLKTIEGQAIEIISTGVLNFNAGPDFSDARIRIGDKIWAGNIEIHIKASDWNKHKHQNDKAYDSVILHVVFESDESIFFQNGKAIPQLELKNRIDESLLQKYSLLQNAEKGIPCESFIKQVNDFTKNTWLNRLAVERIENKTEQIKVVLSRNKNHWQKTFYEVLAKYFGFKINAQAFENLAQSLPLEVLGKHKNKLLQIEALIFGQAGFLEEEFEENYPNALKKEFHFLKQKFGLMPLNKHNWKFLRLRPANFPTIRLAQFAQLIYNSKALFSQVIEAKDISELKNLFNIELSDFWKNHYQLNKKTTKKRSKNLGNQAIETLILNVVLPFYYLYGKHSNKPELIDKCLEFFEKLKSENNKITRVFEDLNWKPKNALQSQAQIQLKNNYCDPKRCLDCSIGISILTKK